MPEPTQSQPSANKKGVKSPNKKKGRGFGALLNLILLIGIIVTIGLFVWAEQQRREAQNKLRQTATELEEVRRSAQTSGQEVADEVISKVSNHFVLPTDPQPTVATISDAAALKEANEFYEPAENGDHLIITERRAILYDPDRDIILDVVPVTIDQSQQQQEQPPAEGEASPTPEGQTPAPGEEEPGDVQGVQQEPAQQDQGENQQPTPTPAQ